MNADLFITPTWPAIDGIVAGTTIRQGGVSQPPYASLNLATHVGDDPHAVRDNRQRLNLPHEPVWLNQVHGTAVIRLEGENPETPEADAAYTNQPGRICAVLTADCLPVLICNQAGTEVAAAHAGWRGLAAGILETTLAQFSSPVAALQVWLGPAISQAAYEVGEDVYAEFVNQAAEAETAFRAVSAGHWMMDIYLLARQRLQHQGVRHIFGGEYCTFTDRERYYSYRRDGQTGRMASLIWIEP